MPRLLKGRWVNDKLEGRWVDDNLAVPIVEACPLGLVSYKKARIERKQQTEHNCEDKSEKRKQT